jgi:hypothetical protein
MDTLSQGLGLKYGSAMSTVGTDIHAIPVGSLSIRVFKATDTPLLTT